MLRMYFVQHWFNPADEACEEALLDSTFCAASRASPQARARADSTTGRPGFEGNGLGEQLFAAVTRFCRAEG